MMGGFALRQPVIREAPLHKQIADMLRLELAAAGKVSRAGVVWFSLDISAYSGVAPGLRTARGVIAGVPDVFLMHRGLTHFIEIKAVDGELSPAQRSVATAIVMGGGRVGIARSADEVINMLDQWKIPRNNRVKLCAA